MGTSIPVLGRGMAKVESHAMLDDVRIIYDIFLRKVERPLAIGRWPLETTCHHHSWILFHG
jgi:hypothetical protein